MKRNVLILTALLVSVVTAEAKTYNVIVADSATHVPLPNASVFDRNGASVGLSDKKGRLPEIAPGRFPITVRYLGFNDRTVAYGAGDTIFLGENVAELPEVVIESRKNNILHILAYVREYSTMATVTDTVFLFREKMVDYMLPADRKVKFRGWSSPRVLTSRSYYRFTDCHGLDSVSDVSNNHFSWTDWIGMPPEISLPPRIRDAGHPATDTLRGRYSVTETWARDNGEIRIDVDVLADSASRRWVPALAGFFRKNLDYENFKVSFTYGDTDKTTVSPLDLDSYSFSIASAGRGHEMFRFNRYDQQVYVSSDADIYILDKEYITQKEAKRWDKRDFDKDALGIYEPMDAPPLSQDIENLMARVNLLDREELRLNVEPDHILMTQFDGSRNFKIGRRALFLLKQLTGITLYKTHKNIHGYWRDYKSKKAQPLIRN